VENANAHDVETPTRLVVRVLQDLVRHERFATYADLADALKARCARLKVPYHAGVISDAIDRVELGGKTPLIPSRFPRRERHVERDPDPVIIDRQTAADILAALGVHVRTVPRAAAGRDPEQTQRDYEAARDRAYEMGIELTLEDFLR
jgi:hypothetical protein